MTDVRTAVKQASEETAANIDRYLELNSPERSQSNQMMMYDEQFEQRDESAGVATPDAVDRFRDQFDK
jgi:hypothetical protein